MNGFRKWVLLLSFSALVSGVAGELSVKPDQLDILSDELLQKDQELMKRP